MNIDPVSSLDTDSYKLVVFPIRKNYDSKKNTIMLKLYKTVKNSKPKADDTDKLPDEFIASEESPLNLFLDDYTVDGNLFPWAKEQAYQKYGIDIEI